MWIKIEEGMPSPLQKVLITVEKKWNTIRIACMV